MNLPEGKLPLTRFALGFLFLDCFDVVIRPGSRWTAYCTVTDDGFAALRTHTGDRVVRHPYHLLSSRLVVVSPNRDALPVKDVQNQKTDIGNILEGFHSQDTASAYTSREGAPSNLH